MIGKILPCAVAVATLIFPFGGAGADTASPQQDPGAVARIQTAVARSTAVRLLEEVHLLDIAVRQWAIETNQRAGTMPSPQQLAPYAKKSPRLSGELTAGRLNDALGNPMTLRGVGRSPLISKATVSQFAAVVQPGFWNPYYEGPELSTAPAPQPAPANPVSTAELRITAVRLLEELRMIDEAIDHWALDHNQPDGAQPRPQDLIAYVQKGSRIHGELLAGRANDSLGNPIVLPPVGGTPVMSEPTAKRLGSIFPSDFWGQFMKR